MQDNNEIKAIDLDALAAPEGTPTDQIDLMRDKPLTTDTPPPAQDTPATPPAQTTTTTTQPPAAGSTTTTQTPPATPQSTSTGTVSFTPESIKNAWEALRAYTGNNDVKMPDNVTSENFIEQFSQAIYANTDFPDEAQGGQATFHPSAKKLNDLLEKKVPLNEALKQIDIVSHINSTPAKDVMGEYLKETFGKTEQNPTGWDEAKINETLDKMDKSGTLEIEAEKIRASLREHAKQEQENYETNNTKQEQEKVAAWNKQIEEKRVALQKEMTDKILNYTEVLGVPVSKAEMQDFLGDFVYLTTPEQDGIAPGAKLLQSNDNYAKALYLLTRGDKKIKSAISEAKEKTKIDWLKKLDLEPQLSTKVSDQGQNVVDLNLMEQPEKFVIKPITT